MKARNLMTLPRDPLDYAVDPTALYDRIMDAAHARGIPAPKKAVDTLRTTWRIRLSEANHCALWNHYHAPPSWRSGDKMRLFAGFLVDAEAPKGDSDFDFVRVIDDAVVETR